LLQFPRPATLQAADFAAALPVGNCADFKKNIILLLSCGFA
jgi:hypothetical protein